MAKLTEPMQLAIVKALACYDTPTEVVEQMKNDFGVTITRQQVAKYDPTKAAGEKVSPKLRAVFDAAQAAFLTDMQAIPISNLSYRLRRLQHAFERAQLQKNIPLVMQLLEQAAKECGGIFTNRRELTGKGGAPIAQAHNVHIVSRDELAAAVRTVRDEF
jgi:hypothetical protein